MQVTHEEYAHADAKPHWANYTSGARPYIHGVGMSSMTLSGEKPTVPRKIIGTLTLSNLNLVYILVSPIYLYKLCLVATLKYFKCLLLKKYVYIVLASNLRKVSLYRVIEFFYYKSTIELLLLLIFVKGSYPSFKASYYARKP